MNTDDALKQTIFYRQCFMQIRLLTIISSLEGLLYYDTCELHFLGLPKKIIKGERCLEKYKLTNRIMYDKA